MPSKANAEGVLTLDDAYRMTLKQSESLAIQDEQIKIAEAHYLEALALCSLI